LDGHHHVHLRPELFATIAALAVKHGIKVIRYFKGFYEGLYPELPTDWIPALIPRLGLACVDQFFAGWEPVESSLPGYRYFDPSLPFSTAELMVHPGKGEPWREQELRRCTDSDRSKDLQDRGIVLGGFSGLNGRLWEP